MKDLKRLKKDIKFKKEFVNIELDRFLPRKDEYPKHIHKAMRHTLFAGGKRLRPYLTIKSHNLFAKEDNSIIYLAGAIEILHTYTLIHDDLPSIDDDDFRRGVETVHKVFEEDIAILAGDSLLIYAFQMISESDYSDVQKLHLIKKMSEIAGSRGLIAGQMLDIESEGKESSKDLINFIHMNKTAKLIQLAIYFGAYLGGASEKDLSLMEEYGEKIGMAFQIMDDILDIEGDKEVLGKSTGKDKNSMKMTYPSVYGLEKSRTIATKLIKEADAIVGKFGKEAKMLKILNKFIMKREN